jgi:hypothetical protein
MKTLLPFVLFVLLCFNGIMAQPLDIKTRISTLQGSIDSKNSFSGNEDIFDLQHPINLEAINGIKPQSKLWTKRSGSNPWKESLRDRRNQLSQNFSQHAVAEALAKGPDAKRKDGLKVNQFNSVSEGIQKLDSIIIETWDYTSNQLVVSSKELFTYDAKGNKSSAISYTWDQIKSKWLKDGKQVYNYDANGNMTLEFDYLWSRFNNQVYPSKGKREYTYDANRNIIFYISYGWDEETSQWIVYSKEEYSYDANGNNILDITYDWYDGKWNEYYKSEFVYDANGNKTLFIYYNWKLSTKQLVIVEKGENTYNIRGNMTSSIDSVWDITTGQLLDQSHITEYTYDENGNDTLKIDYGWNVLTNQWDTTTKFKGVYDSNSNMTSEIDYFWDKTTRQWIGTSREEFAYDTYGNRILGILYGWDQTASQWINYYKTENTYNFIGNITLQINYNWNSKTSQWIAYYKETYYYSEQIPTLNPDIPEYHISVYPNPATEYVVFDIAKDSQSAIVELFDMDGKMVLEQKLPENQQVSVSTLPKGLYVYRLNVSGIIYKGKLTVK